MKALLVRVGADQSEGGGSWNGPVNTQTGAFAYVPIPESKPTHSNLATPYSKVAESVSGFGLALPSHLASGHMHLDPDFEHLTYGDQGQRAKQIQSKLREGDLIVFYAGLADTQPGRCLVYALIGLYVIDSIIPATSLPQTAWDSNAHTRRVLPPNASDIVVKAKPGVSGRLKRCIPVGSYHNRAYRVEPRLLDEWGGLTVNDGYLQRSARLPEFRDAARFLDWFHAQKPELLARNN
jgi:hypothetical protein